MMSLDGLSLLVGSSKAVLLFLFMILPSFTEGFCVVNKNEYAVIVRFPESEEVKNFWDYFFSRAFHKKLGPSQKGIKDYNNYARECCDPSSVGCYQSDDREFRLIFESTQYWYGPRSPKCVVRGCKNCLFTIQEGKGLIIVVTGENTGNDGFTVVNCSRKEFMAGETLI
jgi:hypothetical protein